MRIKKIKDTEIVSVALIIIVIALSFIAGFMLIINIAERSCEDTLRDATMQFAETVSQNTQNDREQLQVIAGILSQHNDINSDEARAHLASFRQKGTISAISLLLPDNTMVYCTDDYRELDGQLSFEEETENAPYISDVVKSKNDVKYIYHAVPVEKNGNTIGILYGYVNLNDLPIRYKATAFGGDAERYMVDTGNGDMLIDTWHGVLGNIYDEAFAKRKIKGKMTMEQFRDDVTSGKEGGISMFSTGAQEYFYFYYYPVGINNWTVMLSVAESEVFEDENKISRILCAMAVIEILFFLIIFLRAKRESADRARRLSQTMYMYDIQETLFDAHKDEENINKALMKTARIVGARASFFAVIEDGELVKLFIWSKNESIVKDIAGDAPTQWDDEIKKSFSNDESVICYRGQSNPNVPDGFLEKIDAQSAMLVPIIDSNDKLAGVLGALDISNVWKTAEPLECVSINFLMAYKNVESYNIIHKMGTTDALTGLKNRNCYQHDLLKFIDIGKTMSCLYVDVNGLHELNNTMGHEAGDEMLMYISSKLIEYFGADYAYRIGGDEFVVFVFDETEESINAELEKMNEELAKRNYHISVGHSIRKSFDTNTESVIARAERRMYEQKQLYYRDKDDDTRKRELNTRFQQILTEKKDADNFMSIISSYFMGVYVVDLKKDTTRTIYAPSFFETMLSNNHYSFKGSLMDYVEMSVVDDDKKAFIKFIDYGEITKKLERDIIPEFHYRKPDGLRVVLRVYKSNEYSERNAETYWLFEEYNLKK